MNILFVCTGNTCRSPMAEKIAAAAADNGRMVFASAGTFAYDGMPASKNAVAVLKEAGIDLSAHRSRRFDARAAKWADIIFAMEAGHIAAMKSAAPGQTHKMHTLLGYAAGEKGIPSKPGYDVEDPYGGGIDVYRKVRDQIANAIALIFIKA